jgi:hypothetical protein
MSLRVEPVYFQVGCHDVEPAAHACDGCGMPFNLGGDGAHLNINQRYFFVKLVPGILDLLSEHIMFFDNQIELSANIFQNDFQIILFYTRVPIFQKIE